VLALHISVPEHTLLPTISTTQTTLPLSLARNSLTLHPPLPPSAQSPNRPTNPSRPPRITNPSLPPFSWDDWVDADRLRKLNDENKEFAKALFADLRQKQREEREAKESSKKTSLGIGGGSQKKKSGLGSELGSFRGSEERSSSVQAPRGTKRARDWEIEKVSTAEAGIEGCDGWCIIRP